MQCHELIAEHSLTSIYCLACVYKAARNYSRNSWSSKIFVSLWIGLTYMPLFNSSFLLHVLIDSTLFTLSVSCHEDLFGCYVAMHGAVPLLRCHYFGLDHWYNAMYFSLLL